jgi:hypothetical protein
LVPLTCWSQSRAVTATCTDPPPRSSPAFISTFSNEGKKAIQSKTAGT